MPLCLPTDLNYITQTPSGTLDNTALTLIQVLILRRGLAVIYLDYRLFLISGSSKLKTTAKILGSCFSHPQTFVLSCLMALLLLSLPSNRLFAVQFLVISFQSLSSQFRPAESLFAHCSLRLGSGAVDFSVELWRYCVVLGNCKASTQQLPPNKPFLQHLKQVHKAVAGLLNSVHKPCKGERCCSGIWRILAIAWSGFF